MLFFEYEKYLLFVFLGWADDSQLANKRSDETWGPNTGGGGASPAFRSGAFTTGRQRGGPGRRTGPLPPFPSSKSAVKDLHNLQSNMARMKVNILYIIYTKLLIDR